MSDSAEIVWSILNNQFCAYKLKTTKDQTFCRNEYNSTGLCNRQSCPLAQPRYATIRSDPETNRLYLLIKEPERAHLPRQWWQKIRLSANYAKALEQVDEQLQYWPKFSIHRCKQRLTRLTQVRVRAARLAVEDARLGEQVVGRLAPKVRRREATRERKAEAAAKIERVIERELVERLRSGAYGDRPLNVEENVWRKVMRGLEQGGEGVRDKDLDEGIEEEEQEKEYEREYEMEGEQEDDGVEYVSDEIESGDEDLEDFEDWLGGESGEESSGDDEDDDEGDEADDAEEDDKLKKVVSNLKRKRPSGPPAGQKPSKKSSKGAKREIEYEYVTEPAPREMVPA